MRSEIQKGSMIEAKCAHGYDPLYWLEMILPGLPLRPNEIYGANKFVKHNNAKNWKQMVYLLARTHEPKLPLMKARIICRRYSPRPMDFDGLVGSFKPVVDGLSQRREKTVGLKREERDVLWSGIIYDDRYEITGPWLVDQETCGVGQERVWIRIEERE